MKDSGSGRIKLPFKKADVILIICFLAAAAVIAAVGLFFKGNEDAGLRVRVYCDGELYLEHDLSEDFRSVLTDPEGGKNIMVIHDNSVCVESADCPGLDCVKMGNISRAGEEIVCLPHRLVIRIEGGEAAVDAVVR